MSRPASIAVVRLVSVPTLLALFMSLFGAFGAPAATHAVSPDIVISQVYGGGGNSGATLKQDFIELYNRGSETVSIAGWSVQYASATGTTWTNLTALVGEIPPGEHYLVGEGFGTGGTADLPTPDATGTILMGATAGKVALVTNSSALTCGANCDTAAGVRDFVGYGATANDSETAPTPAPSNTNAVARAADGATATDNNSADFSAGPPNPRNCGEACVPPPPPTGCDLPATHQIAAVQGSGATTPLNGQPVRIEGVVTGDFNNDSTGLGGFYIQDDTPDSDATTSDGIFVVGSAAVAEGAIACW